MHPLNRFCGVASKDATAETSASQLLNRRAEIRAKRLSLVGFVTVICVLTIAGLSVLLLRLEVARPVSQNETIFASLPLGISAQQAELIIGSKPDSIEELEGILVNPITLVTSSIENVSKYGDAQIYSLRIWKHKGVVVLDSDGRVVGRWALGPR